MTTIKNIDLQLEFSSGCRLIQERGTKIRPLGLKEQGESVFLQIEIENPEHSEETELLIEIYGKDKFIPQACQLDYIGMAFRHELFLFHGRDFHDPRNKPYLEYLTIQKIKLKNGRPVCKPKFKPIKELARRGNAAYWLMMLPIKL